MSFSDEPNLIREPFWKSRSAIAVLGVTVFLFVYIGAFLWPRWQEYQRRSVPHTERGGVVYSIGKEGQQCWIECYRQTIGDHDHHQCGEGCSSHVLVSGKEALWIYPIQSASLHRPDHRTTLVRSSIDWESSWQVSWECPELFEGEELLSGSRENGYGPSQYLLKSGKTYRAWLKISFEGALLYKKKLILYPTTVHHH